MSCCELKELQRKVQEHRIFSYLHHNSSVGTLVELGAITDFCLLSEPVVEMGEYLCKHITALRPCCVSKLLDQQHLKDESMTINDYLQQTILKVKEPLQICRFVRYSTDD